jgi:hypothetical protein
MRQTQKLNRTFLGRAASYSLRKYANKTLLLLLLLLFYYHSCHHYHYHNFYHHFQHCSVERSVLLATQNVSRLFLKTVKPLRVEDLNLPDNYFTPH